MAFQAAMASSVNHTVKLPRCRSASLYADQFVTRRFGRGIWWRRSALYLCGMKARSGASKQATPYAIPHIRATRCLLSPGRRTVTAALRVMDLDQSASFAVYHRVLSTARWSARRVAHRLLGLLVAAFVQDGPVVIGLDDTIERRWGTRIKARGIYRDPVRSSHGHFVKASGLRWLCVMLLAPIPWAGCVWALPFLTILAPSERYAQSCG